MGASLKKILYYVPNIDQSNGGVRQYALNLLKTLAQISTLKSKLYVYHNLSDPEFLELINENDNCILITDNDINTKEIIRENKKRHRWAGLFQFLKGETPYRFRQLLPLDEFLKINDISFIHVPFQFVPETNRTLKIFSTLHDVQEIHFPSYFSAEERAYRASTYLKCAKNSTKVVVSYQHVAKDVETYFGVAPQKIVVCLLNMNNLWFSKFQEQKQALESTDWSDQTYLFYPANLWPHKNHQRLIKAFHSVLQKTEMSISLVLTGDADSDEGILIRELVADLGLNKSVIFAGRLNDSQMYSTYKNAFGIVIPTLYEAGSFPLMEALLMKIPVICSNVTSLPETIGDDRFVFDPYDVSDMAERIFQLLTNDEFRELSIINAEKMSLRIANTGAEKVLASLYE